MNLGKRVCWFFSGIVALAAGFYFLFFSYELFKASVWWPLTLASAVSGMGAVIVGIRQVNFALTGCRGSWL